MNEAVRPDDAGRGGRIPANEAFRRLLSHVWALPTPVIFLAAAAIALALIWRRGGLDEIGISLRDAEPGAVAGALLVYASSILVLAIRWHTLVRLAGGVPGWTRSAEVFLTSVVVNYAAPVGLAVPTRAALTVRDLHVTPAQSGAIVGWEVGLDVVALSSVSFGWLLLGGFALVQSLSLDARAIAVALAAVVVGGLTIAVVSRTKSIRSRVVPALHHLLTSPARHPGLASVAVLLTAAFWTMQLLVMSVLLSIFGAEPAISLVFGLMGLPVLIGMFSPVPGGAGVREALMAAVAQLAGIAAGPIVLAAVTYRFALFVVTPFVWGLVRVARRQAPP